jgi:beta-lactamase class D
VSELLKTAATLRHIYPHWGGVADQIEAADARIATLESALRESLEWMSVAFNSDEGRKHMARLRAALEAK